MRREDSLLRLLLVLELPDRLEEAPLLDWLYVYKLVSYCWAVLMISRALLLALAVPQLDLEVDSQVHLRLAEEVRKP